MLPFSNLTQKCHAISGMHLQRICFNKETFSFSTSFARRRHRIVSCNCICIDITFIRDLLMLQRFWYSETDSKIVTFHLQRNCLHRHDCTCCLVSTSERKVTVSSQCIWIGSACRNSLRYVCSKWIHFRNSNLYHVLYTLRRNHTPYYIRWSEVETTMTLHIATLTCYNSFAKHCHRMPSCFCICIEIAFIRWLSHVKLFLTLRVGFYFYLVSFAAELSS